MISRTYIWNLLGLMALSPLVMHCDSGGTVEVQPVAGDGNVNNMQGSGAVPGGGTNITSGGSFAGTGGSVGTGTGGSVDGSGGSTGTGAVTSSGGTTGTGGTNGTGGVSGTGGSGPKLPNSDPQYMNLAPPMGEPLDGVGTTLSPAAPDGWTWYQIDGAKCRDGSATGFFVHTGTANKLLIFLEGGGACSNDHFCAFNPASADSSLAGTGQTVIGTTLGVVADRQQPGIYVADNHMGAPAGIHDLSNPDNPFKDWSQVYVPYCTGDVFFGTNEQGMVPNLATPQAFVGYKNMQLFIGRLVPTFKDSVDHVVLAGSSAGSFGAALNFSMVQDAFGEVLVDLIMDSGVPFDDPYMFTCLQKRWRDSWGLDGALPPDCTDCFNSDGGGLLNLADFVFKKHPNSHMAVMSGTQDEVMRLFFSPGLQDCVNYDTGDPVAIVLLQIDPNSFYPAQQYTDALNDTKMRYLSTGRLATYMISSIPTYHEHLFRAEFYTAPDAGSMTEAQFIKDFLEGTVNQVGGS